MGFCKHNPYRDNVRSTRDHHSYTLGSIRRPRAVSQSTNLLRRRPNHRPGGSRILRAISTIRPDRAVPDDVGTPNIIPEGAPTATPRGSRQATTPSLQGRDGRAPPRAGGPSPPSTPRNPAKAASQSSPRRTRPRAPALGRVPRERGAAPLPARGDGRLPNTMRQEIHTCTGTLFLTKTAHAA